MTAAEQSYQEAQQRSADKMNQRDQWYWDAIEKYKGLDIYNELQLNPWLASKNAEFSPDLLQGIAMTFGDNSAENRYYGNLRAKANEWLADKVAQLSQTDYHNPINQAAREDAAGINSSLAGAAGAINPGQMAENDQPIEGLQQPEGSAIGDFTNLAVGFISQVFSMYQSFQGIQANNLALMSQEIDNNNSAMDFASSYLVNTLADKKDVDIEKLKNDPSYVDNILIEGARKVNTDGMSHRTRRLINKYLSSLRRDAETGNETYWLKNARARFIEQYTQSTTNAAQNMSHKYYDADPFKMAQTIGEEFQWYIDQNIKLRQEWSNKMAQYSAGTAGVNYRTASAEAGAKIPQWKIDELNNRFRFRLFGKMHSLGPIGSLGALYIPSLVDNASSIANFGLMALTKGKLGKAGAAKAVAKGAAKAGAAKAVAKGAAKAAKMIK